ncbi:MAG: class II aldolase/adducin family protein [Promethearchaeota archaeon]
MEKHVHEILKKQVVEAAREIYARGLVVFGEGNVSVRVPDADEFFITPTLNDYESISKEDVVHLRFDGTKLSLGKDASSEYRLHAALYEARRRVNCVVHTHSPYVSMLATARKEIPVLFEEMVIFLGGKVPVCEFGRANTEEVATTVLAGMGRKNAAMMANHGMVAVGRTTSQAVKTAERVEKMARVYWGALQVGQVHTVEATACAQFKEKFREFFATYDDEGAERERKENRKE